MSARGSALDVGVCQCDEQDPGIRDETATATELSAGVDARRLFPGHARRLASPGASAERDQGLRRCCDERERAVAGERHPLDPHVLLGDVEPQPFEHMLQGVDL